MNERLDFTLKEGTVLANGVELTSLSVIKNAVDTENTMLLEMWSEHMEDELDLDVSPTELEKQLSGFLSTLVL